MSKLVPNPFEQRIQAALTGTSGQIGPATPLTMQSSVEVLPSQLADTSVAFTAAIPSITVELEDFSESPVMSRALVAQVMPEALAAVSMGPAIPTLTTEMADFTETPTMAVAAPVVIVS